MLQRILCWLGLHKWHNVDVKLASSFFNHKKQTMVRYTYYCEYCNHSKVESRPLY